MSEHDLRDLWPIIYSCIRQFWRILSDPIDAAAVRTGVPTDLYEYGELGLADFSIAAFRRRDPYSNRENFARTIAKLAAAGWIVPDSPDRYRVVDRGLTGTREMVSAGYEALDRLELPGGTAAQDRLASLLQRLVAATARAPQPPDKWAFNHRFRVADISSPPLARVRELMMDLFGYRDDVHIWAWRPHGTEGREWHVFGVLWQGEVDTPAEIAERPSFRGHSTADCEAALEDLARRGLVEPGARTGTYRVTTFGNRVREAVETLTDIYFYAPWSCLDRGNVADLRDLVTKLDESLHAVQLAWD